VTLITFSWRRWRLVFVLHTYISI